MIEQSEENKFQVLVGLKNLTHCFAMGEITKFKAGEKSQLTSFCNAKEEILLKKQLQILESMKKQAENALTLDQRIVYNRFTLKLRRSELAHAKLFGNKHLVKQLSLSLFPNLHTEVTDGSKAAVRSMLQNTEAARAISAPCKIQHPLAPPVLVVQKHSCESLRVKKVETKDGQKQREVTEEIDEQIRNPRNALGAERTSISKGQTDFHKPGSFLEYKRPYTTNYQKHGRLSGVNYRSQEICVKIPSEQQDPAPKATEHGVSSSRKGFADQGLKEDCLEQKCKSRRKSHKPRPKNLFLGLDNTPSGTHPGTTHHIAANQNESFNSKVKLFIQKLTALQQEQGCPLQDYYSERLLENLGKTCQVNKDFLEETEERSKWNPVGPETNHRSITIKKVDMDFVRKERPLEMLTWEYYNEILTKENLMERNWPNNNPSQLVTKQGSESFVSKLS